MWCTVEFGRMVEYDLNRSTKGIGEYAVCKTLGEARKLKAQHGGRIIRMSDQKEVE